MRHIVFAVCVVAVTTPRVEARPCATVRMLDEMRAGHFTHAVMDRPYEPALFVDSVVAPLRVHYGDAALDVYVPSVLAAFEDAHAHLVGAGYPPPLSDDGRGGSDALDIYITGIGPGIGALTLADDDEDPDDGRHAAPVHIRVDPAEIGLRLASFAHHELFHAVQFGIDASESLMFFESTAVYQEILFVDGDTRFENIPDFQRYPNAPVFTNGIDFNPRPSELLLYEYGAALFIAYLDEVHGSGDGALVRELWLGSVQPDSVVENEPDWLDALEQAHGLTLADTVLDFATWRALVATYAVSGDGPSFGALLSPASLVDTRALDASTLVGNPIVVVENGAPHQGGCLAFRVSVSGEDAVDLEITIDDASEPLSTRPLGFAMAKGVPGAFVRTALDETGASITTDVTVLGGETLLGFVCDLGEADADDLPEPHAVSVTVWNTALPKMSDDAGVVVEPEPAPEPEPDDDDVPPMCGCQQARGEPLPGGGPFGDVKRVLVPLMFLVSFVAFAFRARRAMKRRASYQVGALKKPGASAQPSSTATGSAKGGRESTSSP